ncbi:acyl-CoA dehydrogenase [Klebsiella michiganensis]|uniref:Acyl-CoA dehydrogenase n=1 Tax=Klebsiella michiganensis TaxID=1134687 RepID=A0A7H4PLK7_9ENTR|nr:acyl-CoA dehydrogenase [Klebsiella michiganensis]
MPFLRPAVRRCLISAPAWRPAIAVCASPVVKDTAPDRSTPTGSAFLALDAENNAQLAFVPRESAGLTVIDDWACLGQRTTASGTVLAEDLAVEPFHLFPTWKSYATPTLAGPFAQLTTAAHRSGNRPRGA